MDSELLNLLQNFKMDDSVVESAINFLFQSSLSEEQYENIIDICNDKLEEIKLKKNIDEVNKKITQFKDEISQTPELAQLTNFLDNIYKIKAYMNDQNDITEKHPSIEYVFEMNYQKENITLFYTNIYDNINRTISVDKCITVEPEKEEKDESEQENDDENDDDECDKMTDSDSEKDNAQDMHTVLKFENEPVDTLINHFNLDLSIKPSLINLLNNIFTTFDSDIPFNW